MRPSRLLSSSRRWCLLAGLLVVVAVPLAAQRRPIDRALEFERRGSYPAAAQAFLDILTASPAEVNALLGLERVYTQQGKPEAMTTPLEAALRTDPRNPVIYGLAVRAWTAAGRPDSVAALVDDWSRLDPADETPYREWGFAALSVRDRSTARTAYLRGRERLQRSDALAGELAQLATLDQDWATAVREWVLALRQVPGYLGSAVSLLGQAPTERRPAILFELDQRRDPAAARLGAGLAVRWGDPVRGIGILERSLPPGQDGVDALTTFLDGLRGVQTPDGARARARALEHLAERNPSEAPRWLAEAARAYADAGDRVAARRALDALSRHPGSTSAVAASAASALVGVLIAEGQLAEAEKRLEELGSTVGAEELERLRHELARGWLRAGEPARAGRLIEGDSSVTGLALESRIDLAQGNLAGAREAMMAAGPFAGTREEATARVELLALLQVVEVERSPVLGRAFGAMDRGDTVAAANAFIEAAQGLPRQHGGAELLVWGGRLHAASGNTTQAVRALTAAGEDGSPAAVVAAQYELARLYAAEGRTGEAVTMLERLILEHPSSSVTPQARRLLDSVRGSVPR